MKPHGKPKSQWVMWYVIVHKEGLLCSFWKLGCIQDLIVGKDGKIRGATVGIACMNRRCTSLNCSLRPLKMNHSPELMDAPQNTQESENKKTKSPRNKTSQRTNPFIRHILNTPLQKRAKRNIGSGPVSCKIENFDFEYTVTW